MLVAEKIIQEVKITEKANQLSSDLNKYTFEIHPDANRIEVSKAVEKTFGVSVTKVNILNKRGKTRRNRKNPRKTGRSASAKLAIVTLKQGDKIELL